MKNIETWSYIDRMSIRLSADWPHTHSPQHVNGFRSRLWVFWWCWQSYICCFNVFVFCSSYFPTIIYIYFEHVSDFFFKKYIWRMNTRPTRMPPTTTHSLWSCPRRRLQCQHPWRTARPLAVEVVTCEIQKKQKIKKSTQSTKQTNHKIVPLNP